MDDLRRAALAALYALETLEADVPPHMWHYTSMLRDLKYALGRREAPEETVSLAELAAEEGEAD